MSSGLAGQPGGIPPQGRGRPGSLSSNLARMSSIVWGDAPTWIAAVFAGGAALF